MKSILGTVDKVTRFRCVLFISELNNVFRKYPIIDEVVIFGPRAKGNFTNGSDIDLAIKGSVTSDDILKINLDIEELELLYKVDVISY